VTEAGEQFGQLNEASWYKSMHLHWTEVLLLYRAL